VFSFEQYTEADFYRISAKLRSDHRASDVGSELRSFTVAAFRALAHSLAKPDKLGEPSPRGSASGGVKKVVRDY